MIRRLIDWGTGFGGGEFYLDFQGGEVFEVPLERASPRGIEITEEWRRSGDVNVFSVGIAALLTLLILGGYGVLGLIAGIRWLASAPKRRAKGQDAGPG